MNKLPFFFLLILLLKITISVESQSPALLKYVLQWPPTFCFHLNSEEEGRCKEPIPKHEFTLHGLMPANKEGFNLECDPGEDPNWDEVLAPFYDELVTFWPSLREDFNETELWKHEWRVHGACGGTMPLEYFNTAIDINYLPEEGNLFNYLKSSRIIPSDFKAYTKEHIFKAIQKVVDEIHDPPYAKVLAKPLNQLPPFPPFPPPTVLPPSSSPRNIYLSCIPINPDNTTHVYLSEVTLCTDLLGTEFISCPFEADPSSCPDEALIMLPLPQPQEPLDIWKTPMERVAYI